MSKHSLGEKAARVLNMVMGMRDSRVATAMAAYGFDDEDLQQAWDLLRAVGAVKLNKGEAGQTMDRETLRRLDEWENKWYPLAKATLQARYPAVHDEFFKNLFQAAGPEVIVTVETFLQRLEELTAAQGAYAQDGAAARAVLVKRGIDGTCVEEAKKLLETLQKTVVMAAPPNKAKEAEELAAAEQALWNWYLEWSQVARTAITNRSVLRLMGFGTTRRPAEDDIEPAPAPPTS